MKTYEVSAKCGHVGKNYYITKIFAVEAESGRDAAEAVRAFPRVKHHHKDAIISVTEIDQDRYWAIRETNRSDLYFRCTSIQEQRLFCQIERCKEEAQTQERMAEREMRKPTYYKKKTIRDAKKYMNNYVDLERCVG